MFIYKACYSCSHFENFLTLPYTIYNIIEFMLMIYHGASFPPQMNDSYIKIYQIFTPAMVFKHACYENSGPLFSSHLALGPYSPNIGPFSILRPYPKHNMLIGELGGNPTTMDPLISSNSHCFQIVNEA